MNGEPYYSGYIGNKPGGYQAGAAGGTEKDDQYVRSGMYGSFLSGGFAGHLWDAARSGVSLNIGQDVMRAGICECPGDRDA